MWDLISFPFKAVSLGKYETKLYHKGSSTYSTCLGGLATILVLGLVSFITYRLVKADWPEPIVKQDQVLLEEVLSSDLKISDLQKMGLALPILNYHYNLTVVKKEVLLPSAEPTFPAQPEGYKSMQDFLKNDNKMFEDLAQIKTEARQKFNKNFEVFDIDPSRSYYYVDQDNNKFIRLIIVTNSEATEFIHATYTRDYGYFGGYSFENLQVS